MSKEESDKKEKASDSDKNNEDKDKENKDKGEEDNVKETKEKQAADKEDNKPSTGSISSNSAYDRAKLDELLKTNVALAKDTEVTIADGISMDELGEMTCRLRKSMVLGYVKMCPTA